MEYTTFGLHNDEDESTIGQSVLRGRQMRQRFASEKEHKNALYQQGIIFDDDSSGSSEESFSEQEWQDWRDDIIRKRKHEIEENRDVVRYDSIWNQSFPDSGSQTQESGASSPFTDIHSLDGMSTRLSSPPLLTSHSSADSLARRGIHSTSRPMSPQNPSRVRPLSPLSTEVDEEFNPPDFEAPPFSHYHGGSSHVLRTQHSEPILHPPMLPVSFAEVSVGPIPPEIARKGRARTSTIMPSKIQADRANARRDAQPDTSSNTFGFFGGMKPKLKIPFLSPGGSGPASGSNINSSSSPMSAESRDSLKFATPSGSDD